MEERELVRTFIEKDGHSMDFYFIYKDGNKITQYKVDCSTELRTEIIDGYLNELKRHFSIDSSYKLYSVYDDNERAGAVIYHDDIDTNVVAQNIFLFNKGSVEAYKKEGGDFSAIYGYLINLSDGEFEISLFKKSMPTQALKKSRFYNLVAGTDDKFNIINSDILVFPRSYDVISINKRLIIINYSIYEKYFGFKEVLKRRAMVSFAQLAKISGFFFTQNAILKFPSLSSTMQKKLVNCLVNNPILNKENYDGIKTQARRYLKQEFAINAESKIVINSKKELQNLIIILNRDINYNAPAKEVYLTRNKKLLKRYKSKK
ncbi:MAG: DUF4868 domain-containing protein [Bacteroidetes bacterium]|nr:DUF4868 domain-containing protein [Bacteroidota bacterium]